MEPPSWAAHFSRHRQLFWLFFLLTIGYMIWTRSYLSPLNSGEIVQFEVAKTVTKAHAIIQDWKNTGKYEQGVKSTSLAYFFLILYTLCIWYGCRFLAVCTGNEIFSKGGKGFSWLILIATICDLVENFYIHQTLSVSEAQMNVTIVYNLARIKFSIVIVCVLFMITCVLFWLIDRVAKNTE